MTAPNPSVAQAQVLADEFARLGLRHVCLAPGSRSGAMAMAFDDRAGVDVHVGIDERSAGFLAVGIARASGVPVAVLSTSGTAAANFHPAVLEADASAVPLLVLTADRPPELRQTGANQTVDQIKLYGAAVRRFLEVGVAENRRGMNAYWRSLAGSAWAAATGRGGPAGPVHCNLAFREPLVPESDDGRTRAPAFGHDTEGRPEGRPWTRVERPGTGLDSAAVADLAERVRQARRGLLVAGDATGDPRPLLDLAEHLGWPVLAEPQSGARRGDHAIASYHHLLSSGDFVRDHRPDLIVRAGRVALSRPLLELLAGDVGQVLVDADARWLDPGRGVDTVVAADPGAVFAALTTALEPTAAGDWIAAWREADRRAGEVIDAVLDDETRPSEPAVAREVTAALPSGATLVAASSMPIRDVDAFMRPRDGLRVVGNRGASGIDGFVSTTLGVAVGAGGPVAALSGDLSILHDQNGFLLLGERPNAAFVVVNNDGGGIFHFLPQVRYGDTFERLFATPHGVDFGNVAAVYGVDHVRIGRRGDLAPALGAAFEAGGVRLLEVVTDRGHNATLHERLLEAVAAAI